MSYVEQQKKDLRKQTNHLTRKKEQTQTRISRTIQRDTIRSTSRKQFIGKLHKNKQRHKQSIKWIKQKSNPQQGQKEDKYVQSIKQAPETQKEGAENRVIIKLNGTSSNQCKGKDGTVHQNSRYRFPKSAPKQLMCRQQRKPAKCKSARNLESLQRKHLNVIRRNDYLNENLETERIERTPTNQSRTRVHTIPADVGVADVVVNLVAGWCWCVCGSVDCWVWSGGRSSDVPLFRTDRYLRFLLGLL